MGNTNSYISKGGSNESDERKQIVEKLDSIVSHYIVTMDFQNMKKLYDKEYCNQLTHVTSRILSGYYSDVELKKIEDRVENGLQKESDSSLIPEEKQTICIEIAKFYVKIAHLYSAIVTTINPKYSYKDSLGTLVTVPFDKKNEIPKDSTIVRIDSGLCDSRIKTLNQLNLEHPTESNCKANIYKKEVGNSVNDEPGIPELEELYYDYGYDVKTGSFSEMSPETKEEFINDLQVFYKIFTQEETFPETVKSFSDIPLKNYGSKIDCSILRKERKHASNELIVEYAENLRKMMQSVNEKQKLLLSILSQIFIFEGEKVRIHPDLTVDLLNELISESRGIIVELYLKCESDFKEGMQLYQAIIESVVFKTTEKQIANLEKEKDNLFL